MELSNQTLVQEFILVGFTKNLQTCVLLFVLFLVVYILSILGNIFLIFTVVFSPKLHTPMYYFLCNLSFLDLGYSSSNVPKLLLDLFSKERKISLIGCLIQMNVCLYLGGTECMLLAVMAYDRYIAICFPLHYTTIINWRVCVCITVFIWSGSFLVSAVPTLARPLVFCKDNILNHFACEVLGLLEVACGDLSFYKITIFIVSSFTLISSPVFIVGTYIRIIISILKIHSDGGRAKAFSTCASHLTVVSMFFGTSLATYMGQTKSSLANLKYITLFYAVFTPVFNPMIYSLRNKEVKDSFRKIFVHR